MVVYGCNLRKEPPPPPPLVIVQPPKPPPPPEPPKPIEVPVPKEARDRDPAEDYLLVAQSLLTKGDFEGSLRENQRVLVLAKEQSPADTATFNMGLIYAHPKNPKKDNKRAIGFFNRVIKGFPESPWAEQARIWAGVLDDVEKLKQVDLEIEEKKRDRAR
jgi:tetratricopeptide (TPR) repeat protein